MQSNIMIFKIKKNKINKLKKWCKELNKRRKEVLGTMKNEIVVSESFFLTEINQEFYIIFYLEAKDLKKAAQVYRDSKKKIDMKNKEILKECIEKRIDTKKLFCFKSEI